MDSNGRSSAIAAAIIFAVLVLGAYFMPTIMIQLGDFSTIAAAIVAALFIVGFFAIFYFRARSGRNDPD